MEQWLPVKGYENQYEISSLGNIRRALGSTYSCLKHGRIMTFSLPTKNLRIHANKGGYLRIILVRDGVKSTKRIHRLVMEAFVPNPDNKPQVNHIDSNRQNNNLNNLEWATALENTHHSQDFGYMKKRRRKRVEIGICPVCQTKGNIKNLNLYHYDKCKNVLKKPLLSIQEEAKIWRLLFQQQPIHLIAKEIKKDYQFTYRAVNRMKKMFAALEQAHE